MAHQSGVTVVETPGEAKRLEAGVGVLQDYPKFVVIHLLHHGAGDSEVVGIA